MLAIRQLGSTPRQVPWWAGRAALLAVLVVVGYWLSLGSLWSDLGGQTPLAFIGLAPILAFALLVAGLRRREQLPFPGRIDLILGLIFIAAAGAIVLAGPSLASVYFWTARLDIASLPLFAAGALILLFGWRVIFVARGAMLLLLLTWPLPYLVLLENTSEAMTTITVAALKVITSVIPIAHASSGGDALFTVANAHPFQVQIATACAGLNSTVAYTLVGGAFVLVLRGKLTSKLAWFALGLAVVFLFNVVRVVMLVAVGAAFGQAAAMDFFHPIAGMVALTAGLLVMLVLLPRFGLRVPDLQPALPAAAPLPARPTLAPTRHAMAGRAALLAVVAVLFAAVNATFAAFENGPGYTGAVARPVVGTFASLGGWRVMDQHDIEIAKPYFGAESTWTRYRLRPDSGVPESDRYTIWLDSVTTDNRQSLIDFGIEKCYRFHGHSIDAADPVALGAGVVGSVMAVTRTNGSEWVVLWWEWPVEQAGRVVHERVTMLASTTVKPSTAPGQIPGKPLILFDMGTKIPDGLQPLATNMASVAAHLVTDRTATTAASK
jgi:exosortase/archaeosortase family protein